MSVIAATAASDCPTPTVSTTTTSNPAASTIRIVSGVRRATPPSDVPDGVGRMYARGSAARRSILVLSPRIEPPLTVEDGSTASTASLWPRSRRNMPKDSMNVDFPTPGAPDSPMRRACPGACARRSRRSDAAGWWSGREDSTRVMARAMARRSALRTPRSNPAGSTTDTTPRLPSCETHSRETDGFPLSPSRHPRGRSRDFRKCRPRPGNLPPLPHKERARGRRRCRRRPDGWHRPLRAPRAATPTGPRRHSNSRIG